jgi:hypothetical protein
MNARLSLLRLAARHPLRALALALAVPAVAVATCAGGLASHAADAPSSDAAEPGNPRAVLGRAWFDT